MNLIAYFPDGWIAVAPSAFSYGPAIVQVFPNIGSQSGGETVCILGYGFGAGAGKLLVTIGGAAAKIQKVEILPSFANSLGMDANYLFSLERITLTTPPGSPGKADIPINASSGTTTLSKSFQYLNASATFPEPSFKNLFFTMRNASKSISAQPAMWTSSIPVRWYSAAPSIRLLMGHRHSPLCAGLRLRPMIRNSSLPTLARRMCI